MGYSKGLGWLRLRLWVGLGTSDAALGCVSGVSVLAVARVCDKRLCGISRIEVGPSSNDWRTRSWEESSFGELFIVE